MCVIWGLENHCATVFQHVFTACCGSGWKTCCTNCKAVRHGPHTGTIIFILAQLQITASLTDHNAGLNIYTGLWNSVSSSTVPHKTFISFNYPVLQCPPSRCITLLSPRAQSPFCPILREENFTAGNTAYCKSLPLIFLICSALQEQILFYIHFSSISPQYVHPQGIYN